MADEIDSRYQLEAAARTIQLLQAVGEYGPVSLAALTGKLGWSKPMVYRLVRTLHSCGALRLQDDRYSLGPVIISLGYAALQSIRLVDTARETLASVHEATGESTVLTVLDQTDVVYVDFIETDHLLVFRARLGSRLPAFCTSSGHVLLAGLTDQEIKDIYRGHRFEPPTPHSVSSVKELLRRVAEVRTHGYALVDQEVADGHRAAAAPVYDQAVIVVTCAVVAAAVPSPHGSSTMTSSKSSSRARSTHGRSRSNRPSRQCSFSRARTGRPAAAAWSARARRRTASSFSSQRSAKAIASQPSPSVAARRTAAALIPPSSSGGPCGCTGRGRQVRPASTAPCAPALAPVRPDQHIRRAGIISCSRRPRAA